MKKRTLAEWASIAEIIGTIAVVISLLTVAFTIERNTKAISRQGIDEMYDGHRELQLLMVADADLAFMIKKAQRDRSSLTEKELAQYERNIIISLDIWDKGIFAKNDGLIAAEDLEPWHKFYHRWVQVYLDRELWHELKWNWESPELSERVEAALDEKYSDQQVNSRAESAPSSRLPANGPPQETIQETRHP